MFLLNASIKEMDGVNFFDSMLAPMEGTKQKSLWQQKLLKNSAMIHRAHGIIETMNNECRRVDNSGVNLNALQKTR